MVDCTGAEVCIQTGLFLAKHGGTFVQVSSLSSLLLGDFSRRSQVGMGADNVSVPITQVLSKCVVSLLCLRRMRLTLHFQGVDDQGKLPIRSWMLLACDQPRRSRRYRPGTSHHPSVRLVATSSKVSFSRPFFHSYAFKDAGLAFKANQDGKGADGVPLIKAIIEGPL